MSKPLVDPLHQFLARVEANPDDIYLNQPREQQWTSYTWAQCGEMAARVASGLQAQGFQPGDRIAIYASNCMEWIVCDMGIAMAGMISVPVYATAGYNTLSYVVEHSEAKAIFYGKVGDPSIVDQLPEHVVKIGFNYSGLKASNSFDDWIKQYEPLEQAVHREIGDPLTLLYTSGSTGKPKGVMLTGLNFASSSHDVGEFLGEKDRTMSYLPMAHVTERQMVEMTSLYFNIEIYFNESLDTFVEDLKHCSPTIFLSVPRLWAKFQSQILANIPDKKLQRLLKLPIIRGMVIRKLKQQLGFSDVHTFCSGSAPISADMLRWYSRLDINICEGWGMTETSGGVCANAPYDSKHIGTIGKPYSCVEMKLSDEDEILMRGDAIFTEYYRNPEETEKSFVDGWFKTGDKGRYENGAWQIVGRVKEQFKTAKGKYVVPVPIERALHANPEIEQCCVVGLGLPQPLALVVLGGESISEADKPGLEASLIETLNVVNSQLESHQRLQGVIVCREPWTIENELLTPTLKLKRNNIEDTYQEHYEQLGSGEIKWL